MGLRVFAFAIVLALAASDRTSAENYRNYLGMRGLFDFSDNLADLSITDLNVAYFATGEQVQIYSQIGSPTPMPAGEIDVAANTVDFHAATQTLFVGLNTALILYDASNPTAPTVINGRSAAGGIAEGDVSPAGNYLATIDLSGHAHIFPRVGSTPATVPLPTPATAVAASDADAVYATANGFTILDASNSNLRFSFDIGPVEDIVHMEGANFALLCGGNLSTWSIGSEIAHIRDYPTPHNFDFLASFRSDSGALVLAALAGDGAGVLFYDADDPANLMPLAAAGAPDAPLRFAASDFGQLALGSDDAVRVIDGYSLTSIERRLELNLPTALVDATYDDPAQLLHASGADGSLWTFDIADPAAVSAVNSYTPAIVPQAIAKAGPFVFSGSDGFEVTDYSDPILPNLHATHPGPTSILRAAGSLLLQSYSNVPGLKIFGDADSNPTALQTLLMPNSVRALALADQTAFAALGSLGVLRIDLSNPAAPTSQLFADFTEVNDIAVDARDYLFWQRNDRELEEVDSVTMNDFRRWRFDSTLDRISMSRPEDLLPKSPGQKRGDSGRYLYALRRGSVYVMDWSDGVEPHVVGEYSDPTIDQSSFLIATENAIYVGDVSNQRLLVLPPHSESAVAAPESAPRQRANLASAPNPFNPSTTLSFQLPEAGPVQIELYDLAGRFVRRLWQRPLPAGAHELRFDGRKLASGVYVCRLTAPGVNETHKLTLVK
jgi:hypothetical protein